MLDVFEPGDGLGDGLDDGLGDGLAVGLGEGDGEGDGEGGIKQSPALHVYLKEHIDEFAPTTQPPSNERPDLFTAHFKSATPLRTTA